MTTRKIVYLSLLLFLSCAYYNTLFNAKEYYKSGNNKLLNSKDGKVSTDIRKDFYSAIDKCWKLINIYSDSSKYADDAFLLIAKSHYQVEEYVKSERFLRQFIIRYSNSNLLPEAYLWLARSLIKLNQENEALIFLNKIFSLDDDDAISSLAYFALGELYRSQEEYEQSIDNFKECIKIASDNLAAQAQFAIGKIYFQQENYKDAIASFSAVRDYDAPLKIEFDALIYKVDSYIYQRNFDSAVETLQAMLRESQFTDYFSVIEAKIGECYSIQSDFDFASRQYEYVLETYPKTEGSAQAAFGLANLMELHYADMDSARKLYQDVKLQYRQSELIEEAERKAGMLQRYLKIKENLAIDIEDLGKVQRGEELDVDDIITDDISEENDTETMEDTMDDTTAIDREGQLIPERQEIRNRSVQRSKSQPQKKPPRKKRSEEEIRESLEKNRFALAEFFLLNMQMYDSALVAYTRFISTTQDTILKPKAYYTIYYIYSFQLIDSLKADSLEQIILNNYGESQYATYIKQKKDAMITIEKEEIDRYHDLYLEAEFFLHTEKYRDALNLFSQIALEDSGSSWAEKSRYAIAWIYEKKLKDIPKAIAAYSAIVKEYPNTEIAKIASNKIKEPPVEIENQEPQESESADPKEDESVPTDIESIEEDQAKQKPPPEEG